MHTQIHTLGQDSTGTRRHLTSLHFGREALASVAARRHGKVYIQASLHADEIPGMMVAQALRERFARLEQAGCIPGEIVLVPFANPIGLAQALQGTPLGRFDLPSGVNFNRQYANLSEALIARLEGDAAGTLSPAPKANARLIREMALALIAAQKPKNANQELKQHLQRLAMDADMVLDLHCDNEAVMHLYAGTPHLDTAQILARAIGAQALLLATESGDQPFDESCARIWWDLQTRFGDAIPLACFAATLELRGMVDVDEALANCDADAIIQFLLHQGQILGQQANPLPPALCKATPLQGVEALDAPCAGIVLFHHVPGADVDAGDLVAELVNPETGERYPVRAGVGGKLFARTHFRYVQRGMNLAKIAGATAFRSGKLLSD